MSISSDTLAKLVLGGELGCTFPCQYTVAAANELLRVRRMIGDLLSRKQLLSCIVVQKLEEMLGEPDGETQSKAGSTVSDVAAG